MCKSFTSLCVLFFDEIVNRDGIHKSFRLELKLNAACQFSRREWRSFPVRTMTNHRLSNQTPRTIFTLKFHRSRCLLAVTLNWTSIFITLISGISLSTYIKAVYWLWVTIRFSVFTKICSWFTNPNPQKKKFTDLSRKSRKLSGPKSHFKNCHPLILESWPFTMISRYERANLLQNFTPGNVFVFEIRRKLQHPK